jgi:YggT family protein
MIASLWLIVETIGSLLASACVIRALSWRVHLSPHNPISQFVNAVTDWLVKPLRKLVPSSRNTDWGSLIAALLVAMITAAVYAIMFSTGRIPVFGAVVILGLAWLLKWSVYLMIALLIIQAIISWVNPYAPMAPALNQLTAPLLAPIRKIIPLIGGVDLSPLVLILALNVSLELIQSLLTSLTKIQF